jgi:phage terminase large subunit-like protein
MAGIDAGRTTEFLNSIEDSVSEADKSLVRAASSQEALSINIGLLAADLKEVSLPCNIAPHQSADLLSQKASLLEKSRVELQSTKRQCELVKSLLADSTAENEIMYEVSKSGPLSPWTIF